MLQNISMTPSSLVHSAFVKKHNRQINNQACQVHFHYPTVLLPIRNSTQHAVTQSVHSQCWMVKVLRTVSPSDKSLTSTSMEISKEHRADYIPLMQPSSSPTSMKFLKVSMIWPLRAIFSAEFMHMASRIPLLSSSMLSSP